MYAIGYNYLIAKSSFLARVTQTIEAEGDDLLFTFEVMPPLAPKRQTLVRLGDVEGVVMLDDASREMLLYNATWRNDGVFTAGLRYIKPEHGPMTIERYMEDGLMVEHVRYPGKEIEMRRLFKR